MSVDSVEPESSLLDTIVEYVQTLSWIDGGNLTKDLNQVIGEMSTHSDVDPALFVNRSRQVMSVLGFWISRLQFYLGHVNDQLADKSVELEDAYMANKDLDIRRKKMRYAKVHALRDPAYAQLRTNQLNYEQAIGVLKALFDRSFDRSLIVQESVAGRQMNLHESQV